ncbi:hypothetical protein D9756_009932 [Leucocoprinus leucothites]|uniref:AMP-dependent synthetase/ligase domain-containing protein n=1 Tax=Leucocoprinus leucothites TaxID=201217 RepID=A0A8H5CST3_9AGAR|nr:hypothetical protein D9756_009932 [Leucoagaricus leucothites]
MARVHTNKPGYYGAGSVEISSGSEGQSGVRRLAITKDRLVTQPGEGVNTVFDIVEYAARTHGSRNALGWRDVVRIHEEEKEVTKTVDGKEVKEKKKWKYFELGGYQYHSFIDVKNIVSEIGRGLLELGISADEVFNVYAQTSPNWQLMAHGCASVSITIATAYDTLGEEGLAHSLNEPNCVGIFTNAELLPVVARVIPKTPSLKYVIYDGEATTKVLDSLAAARNDVKVYSINQLRDLGKDKPTEPLEARRPKPENVACIMYTSGSTGAPKGVIITHGNLVASVGAVKVLLGHHLTLDDSFLAYLPLAHVLEYIVELIILHVGMPTGYGRVKTLTDASVRNCKGDIAEFRPTILVGVPAVWETIRKGIVAKVNSGGAIRKAIFNGAVEVKRRNIPVLATVADYILGAVRAATGGRLRIALCGGAAISRETQEFLSTTLVTILQGYGMTESCGMCAILPPELMQYGSVGLPVPSTEVKLLDVPDAGYLSTNNPPQGEVCIRGPSVTQGYYKRSDLNNDETVFTKDGWMRTGDVGQWNPDGTLSLIDRLKNLIKLQSGEYIALERLEAVYKGCNLVSNLCVYATQDAQQPMAIVIPHEAHLRHQPSVDSSKSLADLCSETSVRDLVLKECNAIGKKNGFKPMELLEAVVLTAEEWTPENGLVTAAQKIQRSKIAKTFENEIKAVYKH